MRERLRFVALCCLACAALYPTAVLAAEVNLNEASIDSVYKVEGKKDLFRSTNFYLGGQPNLETLQWLKAQGVTTIVNLRSEKENKEFADMAFN